MTHDPNVYGYVNGKPVFSRDEFIYESRRRGPIEDDAELIAFAEKATSGWHSAGWSHSFIDFYISDYALSEPFASLTLSEFGRLKELQQEAREASKARTTLGAGSSRRRSLGRQQRRGNLRGQRREHQAHHGHRPARRRLLRR